VDNCTFFDTAFEAMTGNAPLRWQRRLFAEHLERDDIPSALDLPTGLGKTSVIVIWLLALAWQAANGGVRLPRRLVYVVNRRTVVDQATDTAMQLREKLRTADDGPLGDVRKALRSLCIDPNDDASPLAISTLRGELADNREWQADPVRPAIIVGTVDMIGSRLLFSGYGVSRRMRPFHAGLIGQDTLLVHDEAHLTPAFGKLVRRVAEWQRSQQEPCPLQVLELSATQRIEGDGYAPFVLGEQDKLEPEIQHRLSAAKTLRLSATGDDRTDAIAAMAECALTYADAQKRIVVYVRSPKDAKKVADTLVKSVGQDRVAVLTGTIRGYERDALATSTLFDGFRARLDRLPPEQTHYLVATSAGEVGVDLNADDMVCDLTTLDSMIQRLGRVNRLGRGAAVVDVFEPPRKEEEPSDAGDRLAATKDALRSLRQRDDGHDASPQALRALAGRIDAFAKMPRIVPLTDILLDGWAMTCIDELPGRPPVARWLHGIEASPPELHVAWREEVNDVAGAERGILVTLFDKHPILARERARGPLRETIAELKKIAKRLADKNGDQSPLKAILVPANGDPVGGTLVDLVENEAQRLSEGTMVLPPDAGGLDEQGMLEAPEAKKEATCVLDVADTPFPPTLKESEIEGTNPVVPRVRVLLMWNAREARWSARRLGWDDDGNLDGAVAEARNHRDAAARVLKQFQRMVQKALLVLARDEEDNEPIKVLQLLAASRAVDTAQDDPAAAGRPQVLEEHLDWARDEARQIAQKSVLGRTAPAIAQVIALAAHWHDRGKDRPGWQRAIGHPPPREAKESDWKPWAKSGHRGFDASACGRYRHEFGSLREGAADSTIASHPERDLILHLIAAHHGWARPHFEPEQWDIADGVTGDENAAVAAEAMRRFARLQRRFGHWGLAWLEALVRASDYSATERLAENAIDAKRAFRDEARARHLPRR
jgi:CRISPR-associated endonuclease/helicase Cas3